MVSSSSSDVQMNEKEKRLNWLSATSFVVVFIFIGLPVWWLTTRVYRMPIPTTRIDVLNHAVLDIPIEVDLISAQPLIAGHLIFSIKTKLEERLPQHEILVKDESDGEMNRGVRFKINYNVVNRAKDVPTAGAKADDPSDYLTPQVVNEFRLSLIYTLPGSDKDAADLKMTCNGGIMLEVPVEMAESELLDHLVERSLSAVLDYYLSVDDIRGVIESDAGEPELKDRSDISSFAHQRQKASNAYPFYNVDIHLINSHPVSDCVPSLSTADINNYIQYVFEPVSQVTRLSVSSQTIFYAQMPFKPVRVADKSESDSRFVIPRRALPHMISPIEKYIIPGVANDNPTWNFAVYLPGRKSQPLSIEVNPEESEHGSLSGFIVPSWGGFMVYNGHYEMCYPSDNSSSPVAEPILDSKWISAQIISHLRTLMNIKHPKSTVNVNRCALSRLERDRAILIATIDHTFQAARTLQSLTKLLDGITNIVIDDHVGQEIADSVDRLEQVGRELRDGNISQSVELAKLAYLGSERAFADKTLLALLYFPEDQKYAIYIPLFLPVGVPIVLSLLAGLKRLKASPTKAKPE